MIISGLQTGNTRWLAAHLQNTADNELIELAEISGTVAQDIDGALAEFDAFAAGTMARESVYAAFINPPSPLSREQFMQALSVIERALGLTGQPRLVLFHVKQGRHHCHAVWSRIDLARMKAIHLSHDRQKLRRCARELAALFGFELPPGLAQDRGAERFADRKRASKAEKAMAERSGLAVEERREAITSCYRKADSAQAFINALEEAGYVLARGDKRSFVVVDLAGDVHSLARQVDGAKTRDIRSKLQGLDLARLPTVERARVLMAQRAQAQRDAARAFADKRDAIEALARLKASQDKRRRALDLLWQQMRVRQMHEWKVLLAYIKSEEELRLRRHWSQVGLAIYLRKIAVIRWLLEYYAEKKRRSLEEFHRQLRESLKRRHENEARELRRRYEALVRLFRREELSFAVAYGSPEGLVTTASYLVSAPRFGFEAPPATVIVSVSFEGHSQFEGWERAEVLTLPADLRYGLFGKAASAYESSSLSLTFNMNAAGLAEAIRKASEDETDDRGGSRIRLNEYGKQWS
ncbi:MAG: relaxase [Mesorhizobium sp.]|uniref:relaxase/mobilization nuclease domain-containing protein n=1 Tax=Mesorhizobium sp. TaxID=1871066 RepID=UPI0011FA1843|nr:relaxase/mobilization nuclease domain-containing protein [Mesorhizobium sp.]TIQ08751.1 MAG: relaxase [Mesorhizobium sp.]